MSAVNMPTFSQSTSPAWQRGASLLVGLVFLLVLTIAGMIAILSSSTQERSIRQQRDHSIALQAAEAAVRDAELDIKCAARNVSVSGSPPTGRDPTNASNYGPSAGGATGTCGCGNNLVTTGLCTPYILVNNASQMGPGCYIASPGYENFSTSVAGWGANTGYGNGGNGDKTVLIGQFTRGGNCPNLSSVVEPIPSQFLPPSKGGSGLPISETGPTAVPVGVAIQPRYMIEILPDNVLCTRNLGTGHDCSRHIYRITARGWGPSSDTVATVQENYRP